MRTFPLLLVVASAWTAAAMMPGRAEAARPARNETAAPAPPPGKPIGEYRCGCGRSRSCQQPHRLQAVLGAADPWVAGDAQ